MSSSGSVHVNRQRLEGGACLSRSLSPRFFLGGVAVRPDKAPRGSSAARVCRSLPWTLGRARCFWVKLPKRQNPGKPHLPQARSELGGTQKPRARKRIWAPLTSEERCFPFLSSPVSHSGFLSESHLPLQQRRRRSLPLLSAGHFKLFKLFSGFLGLKERGEAGGGGGRCLESSYLY